MIGNQVTSLEAAASGSRLTSHNNTRALDNNRDVTVLTAGTNVTQALITERYVRPRCDRHASRHARRTTRHRLASCTTRTRTHTARGSALVDADPLPSFPLRMLSLNFGQVRSLPVACLAKPYDQQASARLDMARRGRGDTTTLCGVRWRHR